MQKRKQKRCSGNAALPFFSTRGFFLFHALKACVEKKKTEKSTEILRRNLVENLVENLTNHVQPNSYDKTCHETTTKPEPVPLPKPFSIPGEGYITCSPTSGMLCSPKPTRWGRRCWKSKKSKVKKKSFGLGRNPNRENGLQDATGTDDEQDR
jgi:hypothetical protein